MKKQYFQSGYFLFACLLAFSVLQVSCRKNLLNQEPTVDLAANTFWKTAADAEYGLNGLYSAIRPCFDRDYYFDGHGEYTRVRGGSTTSGNLRLGDAYNGGNYNPSGYTTGWDKMYRYLYGAVNRANYVITNVQKMQSDGVVADPAALDLIVGEARMLRGLAYFRLISMWGDVPYFTNVVNDNSEVAGLARMPISQVKDSILADYTYAFDKLPAKAAAVGRASKPAALSLRGKMHLFWASWKKNGWPELEGFTANAAEATTSFTAAAADFKAVIDNYGLTLYQNGDPGEIDDLGKAEKLPNYFHLFTPKANGNPEMIMVFTHGGVGTNQGEELMRDFAGRSHEGSQCWVAPRYEIADRYQRVSTGDFAPAMIPLNPTSVTTARTQVNSAVNPESYRDRDYRMKATLQWDYEQSIGLASLQSTGMTPFIYRTWAVRVNIGGTFYTTYNTDGSNSGYVFRKFVRNYPGQGRSEGDFAWPVVRLADVFLMYAEARNEVAGPQADAIALVNRVRRRGNLPGLLPSMIVNKEAFFNAIEQERIIELVAEGHRSFDIRRWRIQEKIWGPPGSAGKWTIDTWGAQQTRYFQNTADRVYEQNYIFRIPESERNRNPNLTQNIPWR